MFCPYFQKLFQYFPDLIFCYLHSTYQFDPPVSLIRFKSFWKHYQV
jgi:hypothetical protein